ncbi:hypothetical protein NDU88_008537 [Pleurodeles waltl]|uniref:Uncharacterized protein n=1 Tax=Pleurodeles waltl TaxID=8319 RepID=A0AAV7QSS5_PLEWA|nr:hypothetical protein NDU88_008537 [Pleurodeles waltl]
MRQPACGHSRLLASCRTMPMAHPAPRGPVPHNGPGQICLAGLSDIARHGPLHYSHDSRRRLVVAWDPEIALCFNTSAHVAWIHQDGAARATQAHTRLPRSHRLLLGDIAFGFRIALQGLFTYSMIPDRFGRICDLNVASTTSWSYPLPGLK